MPPEHPPEKRKSIRAREVALYPFIIREEGSNTRQTYEEALPEKRDRAQHRAGTGQHGSDQASRNFGTWNLDRFSFLHTMGTKTQGTSCFANPGCGAQQAISHYFVARQTPEPGHAAISESTESLHTIHEGMME